MSALFHFDEDPSGERFESHVPATNSDQKPAVWAIHELRAPLYWFSRDCPRGTVWAHISTERELLARLFAASAERLHVTELGWLESMRTTTLFAHLLPGETFEPWTEAEGQWVGEPVEPQSLLPVGDLFARRIDDGTEVRAANDLWTFWDRVDEPGLPFSGVRLRNARPRAESDTT